MKNKFYIKIFITLFLGFVIAGTLNKEIFIANSPKLRPNLGSYLTGRMGELIQFNKTVLAKIFNPPPKDALKDVPFKMVSRGVYAKSRNNVSYTVINENEVEWVVYEFNFQGKQVKVKVPKGQIPPTRDMIEKAYK